MATWAALVLTAGYLVVSLVNMVTVIRDRQLIGELAAGSGSVSLRDVTSFAHVESTISTLYQVSLFAYIAGFVVFFAVSRRLLTRLGHDARLAMRHWGVVVWRLGILVSLLVAVVLRTPTIDPSDPGWVAAAQSADTTRIVFSAVRVLVAASLILAVWLLRTRIIGLVLGRPTLVPATQPAPGSA